MREAPRGLVAAPLFVLLIAAASQHVPRYFGLGDGTVKDNRSGRVWLADADCLGSMPWENAKAEVARLEDGMCGLTDGSKPGDWRLPTENEWEATVECSCGEITLTDDRGTGCYNSGASSFQDVQASDYWSSTASHDGEAAIVMSLTLGLSDRSLPGAILPAWPVRD